MEEKEKKLTIIEKIKNHIIEWFTIPYIIIGFLILCFITVPYFNIYGDTILSGNKEDIIDNLAKAGDFIGGILNPLFAFFSFMILLFTTKLQNKSLKLAQKELEVTRQELNNTKIAHQEQSNSIRLQNFETTFFNMISLHNQILDNIILESNYIEYDHKTEFIRGFSYVTEIKFDLINKYPYKGTDMISGKNAIKKICQNIDDFIKNTTELGIDIQINKNRKPTLIYDLIHQCYSDNIGHYFGNIYQILKHIATSENSIDKRKYSNLFRAQFSSQELKLLFYHCSASIGSRRFKAFIEEFEFLEHLNIEKENQFFKYIFYKSIYNIKAFGIKNKDRIELIISDIDNKIQDILKNNDKNKDFSVYKYLSDQEINKLLQELKINNKSDLNDINYKLILLDYASDESIKNYTINMSNKNE